LEHGYKGGRSRALVVLEDGASFSGWTFAGEGEVAGEVVFTTSMVGYQETLTDPSYRGQIVLFTYPLIGNYGVIPGDDESRKVQAAATLVREYTPYPSNWASGRSLADYLDESGVMGVEGIDTRALTRHLRNKGAMRGIISTVEHNVSVLRERANAHPAMAGLDLASTSAQLTEPTLLPAFGEEICRVAALDYGVKGSIYKELRSRGVSVLAIPGTASAEDILAEGPDGVFLSNGPGDPAALEDAVSTLPRAPASRARVGVRDVQDAVRAPRGQPSGKELEDGEDRDHEPEPRLFGARGDDAAGGRADPPQPLRRHRGGPQERTVERLERPVPPRVEPRP
jgi:carbamoyl-phosphate synthase small subunit